MPVQIRNSNTILELPDSVAQRVESGVNIVTLPDPAAPASPLVIGDGTGSPAIELRKSANGTAEIQLKAGGVLRWVIGLDSNENLEIRRYNSAGEPQDTVELNASGGGTTFPTSVTALDGIALIDGELELHSGGLKRGAIAINGGSVDVRLFNEAGDLLSAATFGDSGNGGLALDSGLTLGVLGGGLPSMTSVGQVVLQGGLSASGGILLPDGLAEYADDAAAEAGSLPVGYLYRTGSVVKIRVG